MNNEPKPNVKPADPPRPVVNEAPAVYVPAKPGAVYSEPGGKRYNEWGFNPWAREYR